jgi:hypothetical protein
LVKMGYKSISGATDQVVPEIQNKKAYPDYMRLKLILPVVKPGDLHDISSIAHLPPGSVRIRPRFLIKFLQKTNQNRQFMPRFRRINSCPVTLSQGLPAWEPSQMYTKTS